MTNFIPHPIAEAVETGTQSGSFDAVGLFLDISGFTRMTEALMEHGKAGAEALSGIINAVFDPMMRAVYGNHGFVTTFAGDAFTALFRGSLADGRQRAVDAALAIMQVFSATPVHKTARGEFLLQAKIGLGAGSVRWGILGEPGRRGYFFRGEAVEECARAEHACAPGTVALAREWSSVLGPSVAEAFTDVNGFRVVKPVFRGNPAEARPVKVKELPHELAAEFVPVDRFPRDSPGEFRNITSAFLCFDESQPDLGPTFEVVSRAASQHGGYLNLLDFGDKGGVCLVLFGAPQSSEDSAGSALEFSLAVRESLPGIRIGAAQGQCFAGYVGSEVRGTYTALGRVVNLSARLATTAAAGEILLPEKGFPDRRNRFAFASRGARDFKGFGQPIHVTGLSGRLHSSAGYMLEQGVGRGEEKARLRSWIDGVAADRHGGAFSVLGDVGMGKSQLASDVLADASLPARYIIVSYDRVSRRSFNPFVPYFRDLLRERGARVGTGQSESVKRAFEALTETVSGGLPDFLANELKRSGPPLARLAELSWDDEMFDSLDPQARHDRTIEAMVAWYSSLAHVRALILVVEQAGAMDSGSREFWDRLILRSHELPLGVLYLSRGASAENLPQAGTQFVVLQPFLRNELDAFVQKALGRPPEDALLDFLERRTNRIPLFVAELVRFLKDRGLFILSEDKARLGQVDAAALPESLQDLVLVQLDALPPSLKQGLPQLAVLGLRFPRALCDRLYGDEATPILDGYAREGILLEDGDETVRFAREVVRETLYRVQLDAHLKNLHKRAAELWVAWHPEAELDSAEKAYHLQRAGMGSEARGFYKLAAEHARANFLNAEALGYYNEFLILSAEDEANCLVRLDKAVVYELIGEWNNSIVELERGIGLAAISGHEELFAGFFAMMGQIRFKLGAHEAARVYLEKAIRDSRTRTLLPALVQSRIDLARVFILQGKYGEALNRLLEARDLSIEAGYRHEHALALYYLGVVYRTRGRKMEALDAYRESLGIFRELKVPRYVAYPLYDLSLMYQYEGQLEKARDSMEEALSIYTQIGYKSGLGAALLNLGAIEDQRGNFTEALELFRRSRNITEELGEHLGVAYALFSIGASAYKAQEYSQALSYLNDANDLVTRLDVESYRGYALSYLACVLVRLGRYAEAIDHVNQQLDVIDRIKDDVEKGRIFMAVAEIYEHRGQASPRLAPALDKLAARVGVEKPSAARWYRQAIQASLPSRYVNTLIPALNHCGMYLAKAGRPDAGAKYLESALQEARRAGWSSYAARIEEFLEKGRTEWKATTSSG